ncbi:hypothetical protein ABIA00_003739 [Bradyrhizobium ottawaense]|uniref:DUF2076 domain-containing protein n=1 Tax=Bradyrhizobium ottawaense TaxID=931866 RepID=A0A2U8P7P5_9BRAD|nr:MULTISPECIES: DUF2076 domain-containing protein [Bradyrhizobium]AWL93753.1 DUF2076 domain-containing protein [Bradyrhizobium ottawaense]MBR1328430.1 DUF2076 domain-containing protein [Bradyrhizobium ottawaense]MBR1334179.1 DUF2076 domain-containing protein [Bradyrhizobium ottawaense]BBO15184.1 ABC transporter substrate-binding protein [Bradyrhizobium sp. TM102]
MTPQERQLVDDLFDRLSKLENAPRDPDAIAAISDGLRKAPGAIYALVQTTLLQDEALKRAHNRIQELEAAHAPEQAQSGGFLDTMRDTLFGGGPSRGSVPNVPPRDTRPVWNSGGAMQQTQPGYGQPPYGQGPGQGPGQGQGYGAPPMGGGGGSFLGTAAAAAAGVVGGSLLLSSIRGMMGGSHQQAFGDTNALGDRSAGGSPWGGSDQSGGSLARDAGLNDIGSNRESRQSFSDQANNDRNDNDQNYGDNNDDGNMDVADDSDFGGDDDGGSDYA